MHLSTELKEGLVRAIDEVTLEYGVTVDYCCNELELCPERYKRWVRLYQKKGRYGGGKTGPKIAPQALLEEERQKIVEMAKKEEYADLSHRQLSVVASEEGIVEVSPSTVYREIEKAGLQSSDTKRVSNKVQQKPEVKAEKPNQVWSWDLTYIALGPIFVYLFAIIDVFSRKVVGWHLSMNATVASMKKAWDKA